MNYRSFKKYAFALALAIGFVVAPGLSSLSAVQAQDWRYGQNRRDDYWERERERQRREEWRRRQRWENRGRWDNDRWDDDRYGRRGGWNNGGWNNGGWNNGGWNNGGWNNGQVQKGYRDGLDRGQKDARTNRTPTPNNSEHYREGNESYREGFRRGYAEGYRQYSRGRW